MIISIPPVEAVRFFDISQENCSAQPVVDGGDAADPTLNAARLGLQMICSRYQRWRIGKRGE
jgi:hypothetical protein